MDTFDDGLEVITIKSEDVNGFDDHLPSARSQTFEATLFSNDDDDDEEDDDDDDDSEDNQHIEYIFEDMDMLQAGEDENSSSSSSISIGSFTSNCTMAMPMDIEPHPYPTSRLFTEELELVLTNVDGNDSDPDVVAINEPLGGGRRRMYRKSMSLPMSPVGGARDRLDSINFSEFLLSPLKMGDLEADVDFEDISMKNNEFNLLSFMGHDQATVTKESPVKQQQQQGKSAPQKEKSAVVVKEEAVEPHVNLLPPPSKPLSKGKCLQLLRATHERQENMVKRCGAMDTQKLIPKNLFPSSTVKKKPVSDSSLKSDPNWSPDCETTTSTATSRKNSSKNLPKQPKTGSSNPPQVQANSATKASVVSGSSNLSEIKRRFLSNIPLMGSGSKDSSLKRKPTPPQHLKVIRTEVPIVPMDHNYCSPVKRCQPMARTCAKVGKSTILIDDVQLPNKKRSPKKQAAQVTIVKQLPSEAPHTHPATPVPALPIVIKAEPVPVVVKRRAINLEDYKRLRSTEGKLNNDSSKTSNPTTITLSGTANNDSPAITTVEPPAVSPTIVASTPTEPEIDNKYVDPISEAKNKALRMQERRKAARLKQDDIQLKTPLVPILPLAVMTGLISEERYLAELNASKMHGKNKDAADAKPPSFDEIQIVSVGCNTNTTIRPDYQSASLLSNLSNRIRTKAPLTTNSLLFSIQDVVIRKTNTEFDSTQKSPTTSPAAAEYSPGKPEGACEGAVPNDHTGYHHGEDKVIMHLRKDRIRAKTLSTSCQTDVTPEFPELERLAPLNKRHYRRRSLSNSSASSSTGSESYSERSSRSSSESESEFSQSEDEFGRSAKRRRLYSRSRSRSQSCRRSRSRFRSRSPSQRRSWNVNEQEDSRSRSRSRSLSNGRLAGGAGATAPPPANHIRNNNNNVNNNRNRWRPMNPSPGEF